MDAIGRKNWAIAEGHIPSQSSFTDRALISHETACILNAGSGDAHVAITIFFADRNPVGPYRITVPARRTLHLRFNDLTEPSPVPRDTDFSSVFELDVPIVVQHTRLDLRHAEVSLLSTTAIWRNLSWRTLARVPSHFVLFRIEENFRFSKHSFQITDVEWKYPLNAG